MTRTTNGWYLAVAIAACWVASGVPTRAAVAATRKEAPAAKKPPPDTSGRKRVGSASFYAKKFVGKKMADGNVMTSRGDNAASKTLPLGTTARVTNLETGKSAVVTIRDRGPHAKDRILDVSPGTAEKLGMEPKTGVAKVAVAPIAVPLPDGTVKAGAGASTTPKQPVPKPR